MKTRFSQSGLKPRFLSAERLSGFEKSNYSHYSSSNLDVGLNISQFQQVKSQGELYGLSGSAFIILKERLDIQIKIEALLSDIFKKRIRLVEQDGFLKPKIQNIYRGDEYDLKKSECHGLKELITLLTFLYDSSNNVLIFDEPELHLHPQFQGFFMREIRNNAGDPLLDSTKKMFIIITHSPYFLDCKTIDDLKNILVSHYDGPPTHITQFSEQDEYVLKRFLPRFNTHHKQFFFSPNPVFVEGYTDHQIISLLLEKNGVNIGSAGSSIIDVGGKSELAVFFRLCKMLQINSRSVADFDAVFRGGLREIVQDDERCKEYFASEGFGPDISQAIGDVATKLSHIAEEISKSANVDPAIVPLQTLIQKIISAKDKEQELRDLVLLTIIRYKEEVKRSLSAKGTKITSSDIDFIFSRYFVLLQAFKKANVFIVPKGEIEHYYQHAEINYLNYGKKDELFHKEFEHILELSEELLKTSYKELLSFLEEAIPTIEVDIKEHIKFRIIEWIQCVQRAIFKKEVVDLQTLMNNVDVNYTLFSQLFVINNDDLKIEQDQKFQCTLHLRDTIVPGSINIRFNEKTTPYEFRF